MANNMGMAAGGAGISKEARQTRSREMMRRRIRKFMNNKLSVIGTVFTVLIVLCCFVLPMFSQ